MPEFVCRVANLTGQVFERNVSATDEAALRRDLESQDLLLLDSRRRGGLIPAVAQTLRLQGVVSGSEFLFFNQELRALLRAGLPIVPTLDILLERRKNKAFRRALVDVRDRVKSGEALSDAFIAQGEMFPKLYGASLASGERSGELVAVLERFVAYQRNMLAVRRKVVSAMIYPAILLGLSLVVVAVMVFYIVPRFNVLLSDFGTELPWITRVIVSGSLFCRDNWFLILLSTIAAAVGLILGRKTERGRQAIDQFKLRVPLIGGVVQAYAQNRFTRTLGTLQAGGIPLVTSLELSARAVDNAIFEKALLGVAERVREGQSLWESLDRTTLMSDMTVQMVKVGESTGALDEMLQNASDFTDEEIDARLGRLVSLIEPIMLICMAVVVSIMLLSVYYPLIELYGKSRF